MRERPILFSGEMVKAILEGRKTQTRRIMDPQPEHGARWVPEAKVWHYLTADGAPLLLATKRCPHGQPGDRLWVRETWARCEAPALKGHVQFAADGAVGRRVDFGGEWFWCRSGHTLGITRGEPLGIWVGKPERWRPSIHMPRWASRLTLEVTGVRVERLQDISEEDARAEGVVPAMYDEHWTAYDPEAEGYPSFSEPPDPARYENIRHHPAKPMGTARDAFRRLWGEINGYEGPKSWEASPWVWVVSFKVAEVRR